MNNRIINRNSQRTLSQAGPRSTVIVTIVVLSLCAIITGLITAVAAISFVESMMWLNNLLTIPASNAHFGFKAETWYWILLTLLIPILVGLLVGQITQSITSRKSHGLLESIKAAHSVRPSLPLGDGLKSAVATIISMGSGASVGHYGPIAHLGTTLGSTLTRLFRANQFTGTIAIGCGAAAAIATAFNAPLAGIVFSHEVILRHHSLRSFAPIAISASTGYFVSHVVFDRPSLFQVSSIDLIYPLEYAAFIFIGIVGAVIATGLVKSVITANKVSLALPVSKCFTPAIAGLCLGVTALWMPEILDISNKTLKLTVLHDAFSSVDLVLIFIARFLLTALCIGFGFAGGIFSPSLLIGALFGAFIGINLEAFVGIENTNIAVYAICGMMAVTSPIIGAPLTSILIIIELTGNYDLATAALVSVVFSNLVAYRLFGRSLFDLQLRNEKVV
ncbi:MAG: chloride channel protein [Gammaproteobacteria bacterium]|nr:chloride channel protein [Gammaproteobacteria bacterium]